MIDANGAFSESDPPPVVPPPPPPNPLLGSRAGSYTNREPGRGEKSEIFPRSPEDPPVASPNGGGGGFPGWNPTRPPKPRISEPELREPDRVLAFVTSCLGSITVTDRDGALRLAKYVTRQKGVTSPCGLFVRRMYNREWPLPEEVSSDPGGYHSAMGQKTRELFARQDQAKDDAVTPEQAAAYRQKIHDIMFKWTSEQRQACMPEWRRILGMEPE